MPLFRAIHLLMLTRIWIGYTLFIAIFRGAVIAASPGLALTPKPDTHPARRLIKKESEVNATAEAFLAAAINGFLLMAMAR